MKTLKETSISALLWNFVDRFGQQAMFLVISVVLARLLSPNDYALIGILAIFTALSTVLVDSGFAQILIRGKNITSNDFSTIFFFNTLVGVILYIILFSLAPLIAKFYDYDQQQLISLSRVLFLCIPINAFGSAQSIFLIKHLVFKTTAKIALISVLLSGITGISAALCGWGVWALVAQLISLSIFKTFFLWIWGQWKPSMYFDINFVKKGFVFSSNIMGANAISIFLNNIYTSIIGRYFPLAQAGFYSQANKFADMSSTIIVGVIQSSMYPILTKIRDDDERLKRACRKTVRTLSFFLFPVSLGLICIAKPLFIIFLTAKWEASIPYFQLLCVAGIFLPLTMLNNNFLHTKGFVNLVLKLEIVKFIITMLSLILTIRTGIINIIIGLIAARFICFVITSLVGGAKINYSIVEQCKDIAPYAIISAVMAAVIYPMVFFIDNLYILITLQIATGLAIYISANKMLGSKIFEEIRGIIFKKKRN